MYQWQWVLRRLVWKTNYFKLTFTSLHLMSCNITFDNFKWSFKLCCNTSSDNEMSMENGRKMRIWSSLLSSIGLEFIDLLLHFCTLSIRRFLRKINNNLSLCWAHISYIQYLLAHWKLSRKAKKANNDFMHS